MSNLTSEDPQPIISYRLVSHCKPLGPKFDNKGDIGTFNVCYRGYFSTPWMTLN